MERARVEEAVSATARLCLWVAGELEPVDSAVVAADLDALYELAVAAERLARATFPKWDEEGNA